MISVLHFHIQVNLKKGDLLSFSVEGLHRDPAHWSHPEEFYPEHFSKEEKATRSPYAFQAFGQGADQYILMKIRNILFIGIFSIMPMKS